MSTKPKSPRRPRAAATYRGNRRLADRAVRAEQLAAKRVARAK